MVKHSTPITENSLYTKPDGKACVEIDLVHRYIKKDLFINEYSPQQGQQLQEGETVVEHSIPMNGSCYTKPNHQATGNPTSIMMDSIAKIDHLVDDLESDTNLQCCAKEVKDKMRTMKLGLSSKLIAEEQTIQQKL